MQTIIHGEQLSKMYSSASGTVTALSNVSLKLDEGEFAALMGPSGCGKSTLLNIIGLADRPTSGRVSIGSEEVPYHDERALVSLRRRKLGYVFQYFNLLPTLTALENVMLPLILQGAPDRTARTRAIELFERMNLGARAAAYPRTLSGGEMQRVAIARAVVHRPVVVLADEPTGNLDSASGTVVLELLRELSAQGTTILMATHSEPAAAYCDRTIKLLDGASVHE